MAFHASERHINPSGLILDLFGAGLLNLDPLLRVGLGLIPLGADERLRGEGLPIEDRRFSFSARSLQGLQVSAALDRDPKLLAQQDFVVLDHLLQSLLDALLLELEFILHAVADGLSDGDSKDRGRADRCAYGSSEG